MNFWCGSVQKKTLSEPAPAHYTRPNNRQRRFSPRLLVVGPVTRHLLSNLTRPERCSATVGKQQLPGMRETPPVCHRPWMRRPFSLRLPLPRSLVLSLCAIAIPTGVPREANSVLLRAHQHGDIEVPTNAIATFTDAHEGEGMDLRLTERKRILLYSLKQGCPLIDPRTTLSGPRSGLPHRLGSGTFVLPNTLAYSETRSRKS